MKNRKKKLRNINVNREDYKWLFESNYSDYHHYADEHEYQKHVGVLKIWKGKEMILEEDYEMEQPITSAYVVDAIRSIVG